MTAKKRSAGKFPAGGVGDVIDRGKNADLYVDNPNSQLSADSKTMIKGVFDFVLEYEQPNWQWNNSLFMEYGRTELETG